MIELSKFVRDLAWPLAISQSMALVALATFVFVRRAYRHLHFRRLDAARVRCAPVLGALLAGSMEYEEGLASLRTLCAEWPHHYFETILIAENALLAPPRAVIVSRLCEDLGVVATWQRRLASSASENATRVDGTGGRVSFFQRLRPFKFVARAEAAENLGTIRHRPSWRLLVETLADPHPSVRSAAARALGRIRAPESFPALVECLRSAALDPVANISLRDLKMALASFPLAQTAHLRPLLESADWRARFLAADVVSVSFEREPESGWAESDRLPPEIAKISRTLSALVQHDEADRSRRDLDQNRLPPEIAEVFLTRLGADENPDVRARAADVLGHLDDERALPVLLELLEDLQWFVRLHAVRALAHWSFIPVAAVTRRLTDVHWRVREAAAQALCAQGRQGTVRLYQHLLSTADRYSQQQVTEQLERAESCAAASQRGGDRACNGSCQAFLERRSAALGGGPLSTPSET